MNAKDIQCALYLLRYYTGAIDGIFGDGTKKAILEFQDAFGGLAVDGDAGAETQKALRHAIAYNMVKKVESPQTPATSPESGSFWKDTPHFQRSEFRCLCGGKYCNGFPAEPKEALVRSAEAVRMHFGKHVIISSGVRCEAHNKAVGGVYNSVHLSGGAMDFSVSGVRASAVEAFLNTLPDIRYHYAINNDYVHMNI